MKNIFVIAILAILCACSRQAEPPPAAAQAPSPDPLETSLVARIPLDGELAVLGDSIFIRGVGAMHWIPDRADSAGMALALDGGWAVIDSFPRPDSLGSFSISAWIDGGDGAVLECEDYSLYCVHRRLAFGVPGSEEEYIRARATLIPGEWYLAVGVYDNISGMLRLYLNGVLEYERYTPLIMHGGKGEATLGRGVLPGGRVSVFHGRIDDVRIWSYALSIEDVRSIYSTR